MRLGLHRAARLGALRPVCEDRQGWLSQTGAFCGDTPSLCRPMLTPSQSVAIGGVLGVFCGDVATPSPILSQTPSSTLQTRSVEPIFAPRSVYFHVQHRVGHPKTLHHAPIGTKYRNICPRSRQQTNTHRASRQGVSRGAFTVDLTPGFSRELEAHIRHDRHNGQGAKGGHIIQDKQQQISTTSPSHIPFTASPSFVLFPYGTWGIWGTWVSLISRGLPLLGFGYGHP